MKGLPSFPRPVILKYYAYQASISFGFFTAIFTLFLLYRDLDYTQIALLSTIYGVVTVLAEIPTGYVGDRIGRRNSLIVSSVCMTASIVGYAFATSFLSLAFLYTLWGLSLTFRSGTGDAWLYDTLKVELGENQFARIRGRAQSVNSVVTVMTIFLGSALYSINPEWPFLASGLLNGAGVLVLLTIPKNEQYVNPDAEPFTIVDAIPIIRDTFTQPPLRSFVLYMALFFGAVLAMDTYIQPIAVRTLEIPVAQMGILYAGFTGFTALVSYFTGTIQDLLGLRLVTILIPGFLGITFLLPVFAPMLALPMFFVAKGSNKLMYPIATQYINDHANSVGRATILSAASMVYALVKLPFYLVGGVVADMYAPIAAVAALGGIFLLGITFISIWERPVLATTQAERQAGD